MTLNHTGWWMVLAVYLDFAGKITSQRYLNERAASNADFDNISP